MNPYELLDAKRLAPVIRAARKVSGKSQSWLAKEIGVSQAVMSRVEKGALLLSAPNWFQLCSVLKLKSDEVYRNGVVDNSKSLLSEDYRERSFRLPKQYQNHAGSSSRTLQPFFDLFSKKLGADLLRKFFEHKGIDPDFFKVLDNPISLQMHIDIVDVLVEKRALKPEDIQLLGRAWGLRKSHGSYCYQYDQIENQLDLVKVLIGNMHNYERNFFYQVEDESRFELVFSISPAPILRFFNYKSGNYAAFLGEYKRHSFSSMTSYHGASALKVEHIENQFKGAKRCLYRIKVNKEGAL